MYPDAALQKRITQRARHCIRLASKHFGRKFAMPIISYDLIGSATGMAFVLEWRIRLNADLLCRSQRNTNYFIKQTVPHEIAHLIDIRMNISHYAKLKRIPPHGVRWRDIMKLFNVEPLTNHELETFSNKKLVKNHLYKCPNCHTRVIIGPKNHHKLQHDKRLHARVKKCSHAIKHSDYIGLTKATREAIAQRM